MVPPNNFFIMDLIETFHISRKWAFFGLLSHAFFPLPINLLRENFDFECTIIIKHQFVLKSKKKKEFTVPWAQHFPSKQSSSWRYYFDREGEALIGNLFDATLHRGRILLYLKSISMEEAFLARPPHRPLPTVWLRVLGFFFLNSLRSKIIIHLFLFQLFIDYLPSSFFKIRK